MACIPETIIDGIILTDWRLEFVGPQDAYDE